VFSSRRASITADLRVRATQFEQRYGRAPSQRELAQLAQASNFKTRAAKHGVLDRAQLHAGWADKLARTLGVSLASVAPSVWHEGGRATARGATSPGPAPIEAELAHAAQKALAGPARQVRVDARRRYQVPGLGPAPHRHEPGRSRRPDRRPRRPGVAVRVRAGRLPGGTRARGGSAKLAARRRPQHLPAARRHSLRHPRTARHGGAHAHASPREHRAAAGARAGRARARLPT